jgi:site-specific DNA recombinase
MENVALLARVSTKGQEDNSSPDSQLQRGRAYSVEKGYHVVVERIETMSGSFVLARSVYNELLNLAADGQISVIVADIPDRLGRGDAIAKLELLAQLNGARVEYAQPGRDTNTTEGLIQHSAEQMVSGIERLNIRRRTMGGRREWAKRGRIIASAFRPFGYQFSSKYDDRGRKISCELVIVEDEARIVRLMFEWLVYERLTLYAVTVRLIGMHVPTKSGHPWDRATVGQIMRNRTYMGEWGYAKKDIKLMDTPDGVRQRTRRKPDDEAIIVPCPAIVSRGLFEAAQEQLQRNREKFVKPARYPYLLRGRITCARCGGRFVGRAMHKGQYLYYGCDKANQPKVLNRQCDALRVRAEAIDQAVWGVVCEEIQDIDKLMRKVKERSDESNQARSVLEQAIAVSEAQIQKANERYSRFESLYGDGMLSKEKLMTYQSDRDTEVSKRETEKQAWRDRLGEQMVITPDFEQQLRTLRDGLAARLTPDIPFEDKRKFIEMLDVRCIYDDRTQDLTISGMVDRTVSVTS